MAVPFHVDLSDPFAPTVTVDGLDVSAAVAKVAVEVVPNAAPVLHLSLNGRPSEELAGVADVVAYTDAADGAARAWLDSVDPVRLENAILARHRPGATVGQLAVEVLKEWADERGDRP